jgi:hypothetical protein
VQIRERPRPTIMLLGTGHWSNPGKDYKSVEFDDMLLPERQRQISACLEQLARFAPTKVALEVMPDATAGLNADYQRYRQGNFALTANERHQLGFRLAAMMNHDRMYGIDWHDLERSIGWDTAIEFAQRHGQLDLISFFTDVAREGEDEKVAELARIRRLSVRELLLDTNDPKGLARSHRIYMDLAQVGAGSNYIGADVVLRWYERNMKIFVNLSRIATSPEDRVLVVIGGGHLPLLLHFTESSDRFQLVPASEFLA